MTEALPGLSPNVILATFVLFCRIGACLMLAPGVSNSQIPMQIRLFVAVAITLSLAPLLLGRGQLQSLGGKRVGFEFVLARTEAAERRDEEQEHRQREEEQHQREPAIAA